MQQEEVNRETDWEKYKLYQSSTLLSTYFLSSLVSVGEEK